MTGPERKDRFDIQFMRGVAVLAVVIFHAFPTAFPQGFLGVDVFFVISGFLITGIILRGVGQPGFFARFYKRRALRLLPASLVTLAVTTVLAFVFLTTSQMVDYAKQLLGALTFSANFVLQLQTGYFDGAAETKPLLHIWSLSLEEQFYFVAPFLLWLTPRALRPWLLGLGLVLSAGLCFLFATAPAWIPVSPDTMANFAFFMLPARAWELLAGSLCAWLMLRRPDLTVPAWAKYLALAVIPATCIIGFDAIHPRWDAVIVVVATSVIMLGRDGWLPQTPLTRPVRAIGDWSYSLYLVHWPLFSFAYVSWGEGPPWWAMVSLAALAVVLARLQWKYVEETCRERLPFRLKPVLVLGGSMAALAVAIAPSLGATSPLAPQLKNAAGLGKVCNEKTGKWSNRPVCRTSDAPTVAVWGDSYAMQWVPGLQGVPLVQMTKSACSPVAGVAHVTRDYPEAWARECASFNDSALAAIEAMPSVRYVVLSSPFTQVMKDRGQRLLIDGHIQPFSAAARVRFTETLERLRAAGKITIVVGPTPYATFDAGQCNERRAEHKPIFGRSACDIGEVAARQGNAAVYEALEEAGAEPLSPATVLCAHGRCATSQAGKLLYRDQGHLTPAGARLVMDGLGVRARLLQD